MIYSTGVCKSFPPPLVRGGVFLVGSDTKYRDIADGNITRSRTESIAHFTSDTKYRDIADGNEAMFLNDNPIFFSLETKYRDTAATSQLPQESNSCM